MGTILWRGWHIIGRISGFTSKLNNLEILPNHIGNIAQSILNIFLKIAKY